MTGTLRPAFIGVDVACRKGKHLPISICTWEEGRLVPLALRRLRIAPPRGDGNVSALDATKVQRFAHEAGAYIRGACEELSVTPTRIAIDAPRAPRRASLDRRRAEAAMNDAGISCFSTPSRSEFKSIRRKVRRHLKRGGGPSTLPHANQLWMLVGFALFEELEQVAPCIEVYPQAIVRELGAGRVHKSKPGAVQEQLVAASRRTGWPVGQVDKMSLAGIAWGSSHDQLDAYLAAWVAALHEADRKPFGRPPDDVIWVPRLSGEAPEVERTDRVVPFVPDTAPDLNSRARPGPVVCPGCGQHEFKRWPWGWDAHAAHKCRGLRGADSEERKSEYRSRFLKTATP